MTARPQISIILPSFRDERILSAIASIRMFDDLDTVRIILIDGGSDAQLIDRISAVLSPRDTLVAEPDKGIFDGLNKGLDRVDTPFVGWLGSDDLFTGAVKASDVVSALAEHDIFIGSQYLVSGFKVLRTTSSRYAGIGLVRYGLNNPHFSTFGTAKLFCSDRFELKHLGSDLGYFLRIFARKPKVATTDRIAVLQETGGFSTASKLKSLKVNCAAFADYRKVNNWFVATLSIGLKLGHKYFGEVIRSVLPKYWDKEFPHVVVLLSSTGQNTK